MNEQGVNQDEYVLSAPDLPPEILAQILEYIQGDLPTSEKGLHEERQYTLANFSRICQSWRRASLPHLFRQPQLRSLRQYMNFAKCLHDHQNFEAYVRVLDINVLHYEGINFVDGIGVVRALLRAYPNLEDLWLTSPDMSDGLAYLELILEARQNVVPSSSRLVKLGLCYFSEGCDDLIMQITSANPLLQSLDLNETSLELSTIFFLLDTCQNLTELELSFYPCLTEETYIQIEGARANRAKRLVIIYHSGHLH
ncbi:hypothetical protein DFS34DRAFT_697319 [Phlyctochytrium arcticum]|nr:hypothetical protein DFS34DRAFT_697319 [Phlyctochytrium arcticum]